MRVEGPAHRMAETAVLIDKGHGWKLVPSNEDPNAMGSTVFEGPISIVPKPYAKLDYDEEGEPSVKRVTKMMKQIYKTILKKGCSATLEHFGLTCGVIVPFVLPR